jgi:hypothetical protein
VVECLPSRCEALSSNPSTPKTPADSMSGEEIWPLFQRWFLLPVTSYSVEGMSKLPQAFYKATVTRISNRDTTDMGHQGFSRSNIY